ncbi:MAG: protein O-mannosyl-transferase [Verrucomicrobiota bacterium]|jgi:tetratricopeptide (TPR) repeat protein
MKGGQILSLSLSSMSMSTPSCHIARNTTHFARLVAIYVFLAAITWAVFGQAIGHQFIRYDDQNYVYENPEISAGLTLHGIGDAFLHTHARNWHPLTTISHMLDCQLFGLNPAGHHLTNVLLHTATVLLLFSVLHAMTGAAWRSAFVAAVFAIHPLRAESVAWVAERKDVLSAFFFMLTLGAYVRYTRGALLRHYLLTVLFFALGLMSKSMLVTTPFLLLLIDYWPLSRFRAECTGQPGDKVQNRNLGVGPRRLIFEKIPLLVLSISAAIVTLIAQRQTVVYGEELSLRWRIGNAFFSYVAYIGQMVWPVKLAVFYPLSADRLPAWEILLAILMIGGMTVTVILLRKTKPYLFTGWLWYVIGLLPVIGLVQVGLQGRADRYTYLPQIGLGIAVTWAVVDYSRSATSRKIMASLAVGIIALLAWRGWMQTSYWTDTASIWKHALAVTVDNDVAHYNLAALAMERGDLNDAILHYQKALEANPENKESHHQVSSALVHNNLGNALARAGLLDDAIVQYRTAVGLRGDFADAHSNLAAMLAKKDRLVEATAEYELALAIPPEDAAAHLRLAPLLLLTGRENDAIVHYRRALELMPESVSILNTLAWILATSPEPARRKGEEAVQFAEKANRLTDGTNAPVLRTLAASYAQAGRFSEAVVTAQRAILLAQDPALGRALAQEAERYQAAANGRVGKKTESITKR